MEFPKSIGLLLLGVLKRLYYLIPSLFSDPFDIAERWGKVTYEPPPWMFWVLLAIGLFFAVAMAYHELRAKIINETKKKKIRKVLADFLTEGNALAIIDQSKEPPEKEVSDWINRVTAYLEENLGEDYVASFLDCHGLPMGVTRLSSPIHQSVEAFMRSSLSRLQQFLTELRN